MSDQIHTCGPYCTKSACMESRRVELERLTALCAEQAMEVDKLRKDAERFRWLVSSENVSNWDICEWEDGSYRAHGAAIVTAGVDEAMDARTPPTAPTAATEAKT